MRHRVPVFADASSMLTHKDVLDELGSVYRWVARRSNNHDACDLCQEVVAVALKNFDSFDPRRDFCAWLWGIAKNVVANHRAGQLRHTAGDVPEYCQLRDPTPNAEVRMESQELFAELTAEMDPMDVEILMAHRVDGLTFAQIGQEMHMSANAARKRYARARAAFEKAWQKHQAKQRRRGVFILPISASALLEAERARCADVPANVLQRIREAIEPLVHAANGPASHQRPVSREPATTDAVDAFAPDGLVSPWAGSLGVFVIGGILALIVVTLIPTDTHLTKAPTDSAMLQPAPERYPAPVSWAVEAVPSASAPLLVNGPAAEREVLASGDRTQKLLDPAAGLVAVKKPDIIPLAYTLLRTGTRALERGDLDQARTSPLSAHRDRLGASIAIFAGRSRPW